MILEKHVLNNTKTYIINSGFLFMKPGFDYTGVSVVYFCHDGLGHFLMQKRSVNCRDEIGRWDIGAGAVRFDDGVIATLRREVEEEYCTPVLDFERLGYRDVHRTHEGRPTHWIALDFKVIVDRRKAANGEPGKFDEIGWFTLNSLPNPLHSQLPDFLRRYQTKLGMIS